MVHRLCCGVAGLVPRRCQQVAISDHGTEGLPRWVVVVLAILLLVSVSGCEVIAFLTQGLVSSKIKAVYPLSDRVTLVLVDDPRGQLGDASLLNQVSTEIGFQLIQEQVLTEVVGLKGLYGLQSRLGEDYQRTPVDRIGRELGAQQVIHVFIESVTLGAQPGLYRPRAVVQVKVIDVEEAKRVFPLASSVQGAASGQDHHTVKITMFYRNSEGQVVGGAGGAKMAKRALVEPISRDVARLFYDHKPRQPGQPFDD